LALFSPRGAVTKEEERLNRLRRRCDWLEARIAKCKATGQDVSFDVAEASALQWAIERITSTHDDLWAQNRKLQHRIYNQRKLIKHLLTRQQSTPPTDEEMDALIDEQEP
jgi:chromosome segregation ATPase